MKGHGIPQPLSVERNRSGILAALTAFFLWGILPIFWKLLDFLPPATIVAQRTVWSLFLVLGILLWQREGRALWEGLRSPRVLGWHLLSGCLLASNWLLYVWATLNQHIVEAALGYYLNPFFNLWGGCEIIQASGLSRISLRRRAGTFTQSPCKMTFVRF